MLKKLLIIFFFSFIFFSSSSFAAATKNGNSNITLNEDRTFSQLVTDINDATWIKKVDNVITLYRPVNMNGHKVTGEPRTVLVTKSDIYTPQNNINSEFEMIGDFSILVQTAMGSDASAGAMRQMTFTTKGLNGIYPTITINAGRSDFPTVDYVGATTSGILYQIEGLNIIGGAEAHHKWFTTNPNSYIRNLKIMKYNYTGNYTAFQLRDGLTLTDPETNIFALAGDNAGIFSSNVNKLIRPKFYSTTSEHFDIFPNGKTIIEIYDLEVIGGGSWDGTLDRKQASWGTSNFKFFNTYKYKFLNGLTEIENIKVGFIKTSTTGTKKNDDYLLSNTTGNVEKAIIEREFALNQNTASLIQNVKVVARGLEYTPTYQLQSNEKPKTTTQTLQVSTDSDFSNTYTEATSAISGFTVDKATKTITLTSDFTLDQLYDAIKWWLYQDAQMDIPSFISKTGSSLDLGDYSLVADGGNVSSGTKFKSIKTTGSVSSVNNGSTPEFIDSASQGKYNLVVTGLVNGSRVVLEQISDGAKLQDVVATGDSVTLVGGLINSFDARVRVVSDGYMFRSEDITLNEGSNDISFTLERSFGTEATTNLIKDLNGTEISSSGGISVDTTTKTITFEEENSVRTLFSILKNNWNDHDELALVDFPVVLDDFRGISVDSSWTVLGIEKGRAEGFVRRDSNNTLVQYYYNLRTVGNTGVVHYQLQYGSVGQAWEEEVAGPVDKLIEVDVNQVDVELEVRVKTPTNIFISKSNLVRNGEVFARSYRLNDNNFAEVADVFVTAPVVVDESKIRFLENTPITVKDNGGVDRVYSHIIEIENGLSDYQEAVNQIASIAAHYDHFGSKSLTFTSTNGVQTATVSDGYWVRYRDGNPLAGSITGRLIIKDNSGGVHEFPAIRSLQISLPSKYTGKDVHFLLTLASGFGGVSADPGIALDIDGRELVGTLSAGNLNKNFSINTSVDINYKLLYIGEDLEYGEEDVVLGLGGTSATIDPLPELIQLYADENQKNDDVDTGTKAWNTSIDDIEIDWSGRRIVAPNSLSAFEVNYAYRAWYKALQADYKNLRYGRALRGVNQRRNASASNNAHLYTPTWQFDDNWVLDVRADRPKNSLLEIQAGGTERVDTQNRSNLIYLSPLSNNEPVIIRIVSGVDTESNIRINQKLDELRELSKAIQGEDYDKALHSLSKLQQNLIDTGVLTTDTILDLFNE